MKKMKLGFIAFQVTGIMLLFLTSCSSEDAKENITETQLSHKSALRSIRSDDSDKLLLEKYNLYRFELDFGKYSILIEGKPFKKENATAYKNENYDKVFVVVEVEENKDNYFLVEGVLRDGKFITDKTIFMENTIDSEGNGKIFIKNLTENLSFEGDFKDGKPTGSYTPSNSGTTTTETLCQRKGDETYRQCFLRESDEFCDDFISTVAYIAHPAIQILIAAQCTCYE